MLTILHISDVHLGPFYRPDVAEALIAIAPQMKADLIVASGDFTQRATPQQFQDARQLLDRLPSLPCMVTPGNHDIPLYRFWERVLDPYKLYKKHIFPTTDSVWQNDHAVVYCMNTTAPMRKITNGRVTQRQLDRCAKAFIDAGTDRYRIVVAHHQFAPAPFMGGDGILTGARQALDRLASLKVDLLLGGHMHRGYVGNSLDVYAGKNREHGVVIVHSGTTTSRRGRGREQEKNTFNLLHLHADSIDVTHYMYFSDAGGFVPLSRHTFPRPRRQWLI